MCPRPHSRFLVPLLALVAALALGTVACDDGSGSGGSGGDMDGDTDVDTSGTQDDVPGQDTPTGDCQTVLDPGGDADGDGLANGIEDSNLNCVVDEGETDPNNSDTDNDGKDDGDEDINGDGVIELDKGETDPTLEDSDGDGTIDGLEITAVTCTRDLLEAVDGRGAQGVNATLALPPSFNLVQQQAANGATFSDPAQNSFGWIVSRTPEGQNPEQEHSAAKLAVATDGNVLVEEFKQQFQIPGMDWTAVPPVPATNGVRALLRARYGAGTANETIDMKDPAVLRDEILSSLGGAMVDSGETGSACADLNIHWFAQLRPSIGDFVVAGLITCQSDFDASTEIEFIFEDLFGGTTIAPGEYLPEDFLCEEIVPREGGGVVDFLWVIDNSGSMADEQANVANTVDEFLTQLATAGVDWRLGVTTSEAYLIPDVNDVGGRAFGNGPDEKIDLQSGLRAPGFISADNPDAAALFRENVTFDEGCDRSEIPGAQPGDNICGNGLEHPMESGWVVLDAAAAETREAHSLRDDAFISVIWLSDEETSAIKDGTDVAPPDDPAFTAHVAEAIDRYSAHGAKTYAIVGDDGINAGGACELLDTTDQSAVDGAEPGRTYREVANELGGATASICNEDLSTTIEAIIRDALNVASSYELSGYPISSSIRVAVDGELVDRSRTNGWNYDWNNNAIVFFGDALPTAQSEISVAYLLWLKQGG